MEDHADYKVEGRRKQQPLSDRVKFALILGASAIIAAWVHGAATENAYESCVRHLTKDGKNPLLCAPGLAR